MGEPRCRARLFARGDSQAGAGSGNRAMGAVKPFHHAQLTPVTVLTHAEEVPTQTQVLWVCVRASDPSFALEQAAGCELLRANLT